MIIIIHAAAVTTSKLMVSQSCGQYTRQLSMERTRCCSLRWIRSATSFVYISSMEIYGQPSKEGKTGRTGFTATLILLQFRSCYPEGKRMCECLVHCVCVTVRVKCEKCKASTDIWTGYSSYGKSGICTICKKRNEWPEYCVAHNGHFRRQLCLYKGCRESDYYACLRKE